MIYRLNDPVSTVKGIGDTLRVSLAKAGVNTVLDLVLQLPYRYEDRSNIVSISELQVDEPATIKAVVLRANISYRGRRTTVRATVEDESGKINCIWFNNRFVINQLKEGRELFLAGKLSERGMLVQPTVEVVSDDTIHTARLVPIYSQLAKDLKLGSLRRIIKEVVDHLQTIDDPIAKLTTESYPNFVEALQTLHFPDEVNLVEPARERLALEELLRLIKQSHQVKERWQSDHHGQPLKLKNYDPYDFSAWLPQSIPFKLTKAQVKVTQEILADLQKDVAMNRLLTGDVGSGKTVVAGLAVNFVQQNNFNAALIAPTQILAQQHTESLTKLFPELSIKLLTAKQSAKFELNKQPTLYIGTHAVINRLETIQPTLIVYDEQHRFGVKQRSLIKFANQTPHILTMSATPIPRSLMLTLFLHLSLSVIDELPPGIKPTKTWLVPRKKRAESWQWVADKVTQTNGQALVVCPFIEPSIHETLGNVAAATKLFEEIKSSYKKSFPKLKLGLLHGALKSEQKQAVIEQVFAKQIDVLVTTPVVEVGVDLPAANVVVVEGAERFGLASLHQLRGRVGRAGQESFCLLFMSNFSQPASQRLKTFSQEHDGLKLAQQDLKNRGAGDLFGFRQHGLSDLKFASWTDLKLIQSAHQLQNKLETNWQPLITFQFVSQGKTPTAN
ncbi:MAG TPA: ATP-dependent DNA helicase RecG [Patescibacteria group bacterium]|jgi:ATP-dependent DNA helicase RecG